VLAALALFLEGCGRANPATVVIPSPSPPAVPTPASVHPVSGDVFYDENRNGVIDDGEELLLPHVVLNLGRRSVDTDTEGVYGTNDWNLSACHRVITCFTIENTRSMIRQAKAAGTIPVVSTIIPVNPAYVNRLADERNFWVDQTNAALVPMARAEGAIVADLN